MFCIKKHLIVMLIRILNPERVARGAPARAAAEAAAFATAL